MCEKPVKTMPFKKRINTEQVKDRTAALYLGETSIVKYDDKGIP